MNAAHTISRYKVQKCEDGSPLELGRDSTGVTYKAFDAELERLVALKFVEPTALPNRDAEERFARDAKSAMDLRHPYIAAFFDYGKTPEGTRFCVTELCEGRTLQNLVEEEGPLPWRRALEVAACAADALAAAAEIHLVHGDIRPSNLILQRENEVFTLMGLGQVKPSAGEIPGAVAFASPERLRNGIVDIRSDIYSLGATLWFMLVGAPPAAGSLPPKVPETVTSLIGRMLEKNPAMRPQTADDLLDNINVCLYSERKRPSPDKLPRPQERSPDPGRLPFERLPTGPDSSGSPKNGNSANRDQLTGLPATTAKPKTGKKRFLAIPLGIAAAVALTSLVVSEWIHSHSHPAEVRDNALVRQEPSVPKTSHVPESTKPGDANRPPPAPELVRLAPATPAEAKAPATGTPAVPAIKAQRDPSLTNTATWRTYAPGQAPPGKVLPIDDVAALADRNKVGERIYLRGDFRVTASNPSRAILRDANKSDDPSPRVVVEYPSGVVAPEEGKRISRDASHPYQVFNIRRAADGVVTIWTKEITR